MAKNDKLPGGRAFKYAADIYLSLNPTCMEFDGNCRAARKIYKVLERCYTLGLQHGALSTDTERRRIQRMIGKNKT